MTGLNEGSRADDLAAAVRAALGGVIDPELGLPITELGMVGWTTVTAVGTGYRVDVGIDLTTPGCPMKPVISDEVRRAVRAVAGVEEVGLVVGSMDDAQRSELRRTLLGRQDAAPSGLLPDVAVVAVASGKGGVGKSTIAANLAAGLAARGRAVGFVDADIYGYSAPRQLGIADGPRVIGDLFVPPAAHGVKAISIGSMVRPGQPIAWRGPMLHQLLQQFVHETAWGPIDTLVIDLPPGTGDVALSVGELLPQARYLVVTTPQGAASEVAERAGQMAVLAQHPVLGVVENMSWHVEADGRRVALFGEGGGRRVATALEEAAGVRVPLLGQVPVDAAVVSACDRGEPVVLSAPDSVAARALAELVAAVDGALSPAPARAL